MIPELRNKLFPVAKQLAQWKHDKQVGLQSFGFYDLGWRDKLRLLFGGRLVWYVGRVPVSQYMETETRTFVYPPVWLKGRAEKVRPDGLKREIEAQLQRLRIEAMKPELVNNWKRVFWFLDPKREKEYDRNRLQPRR